MKRFIVFTLFIFNVTAHDKKTEERIALLQNLEQHVQETIGQKNKFNPEQLQFLLNFSCASYALVFTELKLLEEAQFILPMAWHIRFDNEEPMINEEHIQFMQRSLERANDLLKVREILRNALDRFSQQLNEPSYQDLKNVIEQMTDDGTLLINYITSGENAEMCHILEKSKNILYDVGSMFQAVSQSYAALSNKAYPFLNRENSATEMVETALSYITTLATQTKKAMEAIELNVHKIKEMQQFGALVFYIYYTTIYDSMKARNIDTAYFGMLFEENVVISQDPKTRTLKEPILDRNLPFFEKTCVTTQEEVLIP